MYETEFSGNAIVEDLFRQILDALSEGTPAGDCDADTSGLSDIVCQIVLNGTLYTISRATVTPGCFSLLLSPREKEIVRLVANGMANKNIALLLEISPWTVATHLRRVFIKLGVRSRAEMIARLASEKALPR